MRGKAISVLSLSGQYHKCPSLVEGHDSAICRVYRMIYVPVYVLSYKKCI